MHGSLETKVYKVRSWVNGVGRKCLAGHAILRHAAGRDGVHSLRSASITCCFTLPCKR